MGRLFLVSKHLAEDVQTFDRYILSLPLKALRVTHSCFCLCGAASHLDTAVANECRSSGIGSLIESYRGPSPDLGFDVIPSDERLTLQLQC